MLYWTAVFLIISLIAAVFGYTGIAKEAAQVSKVIFFISVLFLIASLGFSFLKFLMKF